MKNLYDSFFAALFLSVSVFASCTQAPLTTELLERKDIFALTQGRKESFSMDISIEYPCKGISQEVVRLMNEEISENLFGEEFRSADMEEALKNYQAASLAGYRESGLNLINEFDEEEIASFNWDEILEGHFMEPCRGIRSYMIYKYGYHGGAHGCDFEIYVNFDGHTGKSICEKDIFTDNYYEILGKELSRNLEAYVNDPEEYERLFVKDLEPNGNFKAGPEGITYVYGRYDIGPYSMGITHLTIPWERLEALNILKI